MKKITLFFCLLLFSFSSLFSQQKEIVLDCTGYGFDNTEANGIADDMYTYLQKFANLTYNGQDARPTAIRFYVDWHRYEPTVGNYQGAKLVTAMQTLRTLFPAAKIALHFPFIRPGYQPLESREGFFADEDLARIYNGDIVQTQISWTCPSVFSQTARTRFYNFVNDALSNISAFYSNILYVQMGNGQNEELGIPYMWLSQNGFGHPGMYEQKAVDAWRNEYLPCRYPGQSTVTWDGTQYTIASAPTYYPGEFQAYSSDLGKEYHRFASWGVMRLFKGFRDVVKARSSSLKVLFYASDFGTLQGNLSHMHNSSIPMSLQEADGIYTTEGGYYDLWKKVMAIDAIKGTNPNKIAGVEFDQEDLGQGHIDPNNPGAISANTATEWFERFFKHGVDYVHLAMTFNDGQIEQLKPVLAAIKATYVTANYQSPARGASTPVNIYPNSFTGNSLFQSTWESMGGNNFSTTDVTPKSLVMSDDGYWQNIWSCSVVNPCDFNMSASTSNANPTGGTSITLNSSCSGNSCSGLTYSWSGNGISGSNSSVTFNAPSTAGTYTYTITASKNGCTNKTATVQVTVAANCDFNMSVSASNSNPTGGASVVLTSSCSGANCSGLTYTWSGNGISSSNSSVTFNAPSTAGMYTYTLTTSKSGCSNKTTTTSITIGGSGNPCNFTDKQTIGTWTLNNFAIQTRSYTVNGTQKWLIVSAAPGSTTDKHFPRGNNFVDRTDISWTNGAPNKSCLGGGETGWGGLEIPGGITTPSGYIRDTTEDGSIFFEEIPGCTTPAAPSLSASSSTITQGSSTTLSASGCSGGTITWSDGLGTGTSKSVSPTATKTYTATCSISSCTSSNGSVTITVTPPSGINCSTLSSDVNGASCSWIEGWVYDQSHPNATVYVDIYEGSTLIAGNVAAGNFRQDLLNAGYGNGNHGLELQTPASLKDGQSHTLTFKVTGCSSYQLNGSPRTVSGCSGDPLMLDPNAAEQTVIKKQFIVSPNPNKGIFESSFYLEKGKKATLVVYDPQGRIIYKQSIVGQGTHKEKINLANKASGLFLLQLVTAERTEVKRINVVR